MSGIRLTVTHPDFEDDGGNQRRMFIEGVQQGWPQVKSAESLSLEMSIAEDVEAKAVRVFFSYGDNGVGVRAAERAVAAFIATVSLGVLSHKGSDVLPAYAFAIERDFTQGDGPTA